MSLSFMMRRSCPSILTSVPDHLPNKILSPDLTSNWRACAARRASQSSAVVRGSSRTCIIAGRRIFSKPARKRLAGDTARAATSDEVKDLRREASALKEVVAELTLENRLLKKSLTADGADAA